MLRQAQQLQRTLDDPNLDRLAATMEVHMRGFVGQFDRAIDVRQDAAVSCRTGRLVRRRYRSLGAAGSDLLRSARRSYSLARGIQGGRRARWASDRSVVLQLVRSDGRADERPAYTLRWTTFAGVVGSPTEARSRDRRAKVGAEGGIRTPTILRSPAPQAGASAVPPLPPMRLRPCEAHGRIYN